MYYEQNCLEQGGEKTTRENSAKFSEAIVNAVDGLADLSSCPNIKALKNHKYDYRLRVGRYRIFFDHDQIIKIVWIQEVRKRDEHTY